MKPKWITFTGLDEKTDFDRVEDISKRFPVEWGILFGGKLGSNRYPGTVVVDSATSRGLVLSMHLCGSYAADANKNIPPANYSGFNRIQVNRAPNQYDLESLQKLHEQTKLNIIVQHRTQEFPDDIPGIQWLQDNSGGKGVLPSYWSKPFDPDQLVGYAGGLNPDNVAQAVNFMPAKNFWIDMETGIRTDDWLDLDKCEAVCKAIYE